MPEPSLFTSVAHIIDIIIQLSMTLHRRIHRQHQLRIAVMRALVIHIFPRHHNQPLVLTQPPLLLPGQVPAPVFDPVDIQLLLVHGPAVQVVARERRVREGPVVFELGVVVGGEGFRLEVSGGVVSASVPVSGKGVFHAVVVQEVGGVVVVVEVFVAPEVSLDDLARSQAVAAGGPLAVALPVVDDVTPWHEVRQEGFAVAECGA